jgi:hypothetical protein
MSIKERMGRKAETEKNGRECKIIKLRYTEKI